MNGLQRIARMAGAGAALALLLAGCSSGTGSAGSESAAALTTGQTPEQSPTATGSSASSSGRQHLVGTSGGMSGMAMSAAQRAMELAAGPRETWSRRLSWPPRKGCRSAR